MRNDNLELIRHIDNTSTRTLADVVTKRHSDVLRTITALERTLADANLRSLWKSNTYIDCQGKKRKEYILSKKGLLLIASKYSDRLRLQIIERLEQLEKLAIDAQAEEKRSLELELSLFWNKSDSQDLYR
ncbi:MAG: Rha family transcriptional regulator [Bacteroidota bacterium]